MTKVKEVVMDKKLRTRWIRALRSGKYRKTVGYLEKVSTVSGKTLGNCCLGVLCRITDQKFIKHKTIDGVYYVPGLSVIRPGNSGLIPPSIGKKFGLTMKMQILLAALNDGRIKQKNGKIHTFKSIADFIKVRLKAA